MKKTQSDSKMNSASLEKVTFALIGNCEKYRSLKKTGAKRNLLKEKKAGVRIPRVILQT